MSGKSCKSKLKYNKDEIQSAFAAVLGEWMDYIPSAKDLEYQEFAVNTHRIVSQLQKAGFSREEAMTILITVLGGRAK